jgi:hypothetical protein
MSVEQRSIRNRILVPVTGVLLLILLLAAIAVAGWAIWLAGALFVRAFAASPAPAQAGIIAGSASILLATGWLLLHLNAHSRRMVRAQQLQQKGEIYEEFVQSSIKALGVHRVGRKHHSDRDLLDVLAQNGRRLLIWGSDTVLSEYLRFRGLFGAAEYPTPIEIAQGFDSLVRAMRRDLGHTNDSLDDNDVWSAVLPSSEEVAVRLR